MHAIAWLIDGMASTHEFGISIQLYEEIRQNAKYDTAHRSLDRYEVTGRHALWSEDNAVRILQPSSQLHHHVSMRIRPPRAHDLC